MSHSLFNEFNTKQTTTLPSSNPLNQFTNFIGEFNKFRSTFSGNPEAQVKQLLSSGQMSQEQFKQFASIANTFRGKI